MYNDDDDIYNDQDTNDKKTNNKQDEYVDYEEGIDYQYNSGLEQDLHTEENIIVKPKPNKYIIFSILAVIVAIILSIVLFFSIVNMLDDGSKGIIVLNQSKIELSVNQSSIIHANIEGTKIKPIIQFESDDDKIVKVDNNGVIKGIKKGKTSVKISFVDKKGNIHEEICEIVVK